MTNSPINWNTRYSSFPAKARIYTTEQATVSRKIALGHFSALFYFILFIIGDNAPRISRIPFDTRHRLGFEQQEMCFSNANMPPVKCGFFANSCGDEQRRHCQRNTLDLAGMSRLFDSKESICYSSSGISSAFFFSGNAIL